MGGERRRCVLAEPGSWSHQDSWDESEATARARARLELTPGRERGAQTLRHLSRPCAPSLGHETPLTGSLEKADGKPGQGLRLTGRPKTNPTGSPGHPAPAAGPLSQNPTASWGLDPGLCGPPQGWDPPSRAFPWTGHSRALALARFFRTKNCLEGRQWRRKG